MAKLRAHGTAIGTVFFTYTAKRYMSDGVILKNQGCGWKLYGKVKPHITPQQAFDNAREKNNALLVERPELAAYRKQLHSLAGLSKRWKLHCAIELMPDDPDGVWSETCDGFGDNVSASIDDVAKLCRLHRAVVECAKLRAAA